jgi:hypothetical protein
MADAREPRHVAAEFGRDHLGRSARSAGNRVEPGECVGICRGEPLDEAIGRRDGVVEELDMAQAVVEHEAVVGRGAPGERLPQGRALPAHPPLGQLGEGLGGMVWSPAISALSIAARTLSSAAGARHTSSPSYVSKSS